jgi:hypothetical protein
MTLPLRLVVQGRDLFRRGPFEWAVAGLAVVYAALQLSPSSYALALAQLGTNVSPWLGHPQAIRSDEWAILTPLFQAAVNNGMAERNATSFYHESLLSIFGLPLLNWGFIFKPQLWPFLVLPPSFAYSMYWAAMAALMLTGWSLLLRRFGFSRNVAALLAMLLFFSPFVQTWWTIFDSQLAFFPWVALAVVGIKSNVRAAVAVAMLIPIWWISFLYVPGLPPLFYLGSVLCGAFSFKSLTWRRLAAVGAGGALGASITFLYFRPILGAYAHSVFPGQRWIVGGRLPGWIAASQLLPGTTTEFHASLIGLNICEVSTVATWLPVLALCIMDVGAIRRGVLSNLETRQDLQRIGILLIALVAITIWQLTSWLAPMSYVVGFGLSPEQRTLFASGALLVIAAGYAVDRLPICVSVWRLGVFAAIVLGGWVLASFDLQPGDALGPRDELVVLIPLLALMPFAITSDRRSMDAWRPAILLLAITPVIIVWGLFNPVQRTDVMFRKPHTNVTRSLDQLSEQRPNHAIAAPGFSGGVLNGVGYRSVSHVIPTPSPHLFRRYFGSIEETQFNIYFNRYVNVGVADVKSPTLLSADYLQIPIQTMSRYAAVP